MAAENCKIRLTVKTSLIPLPDRAFSFEAVREGRSVWCVRSVGFEGKVPWLEVQDEIIGETLVPAENRCPVLYLTKITPVSS